MLLQRPPGVPMAEPQVRPGHAPMELAALWWDPYMHMGVHIWVTHILRAAANLKQPFSAFWLRSSVVSVLISLISDMMDIVHHDINEFI